MRGGNGKSIEDCVHGGEITKCSWDERAMNGDAMRASERTLERRFSLSHQATVVPRCLLSGVVATRRGLLFEGSGWGFESRNRGAGLAGVRRVESATGRAHDKGSRGRGEGGEVEAKVPGLYLLSQRGRGCV
jgi:hypothetical protein